MLAKKVTALLVSAALVLALLAGCGGSKALSQVIADLLSGLYTNVDVEVDSDLTAALKKAAAEGGTEDEILTRLVNNLNITGGSITFTRLGDGQQGDHGVDLVFQTGSDPDAAARSALAQWASVFGSLPDDGSYRAHVSMIEAENGYYIAVDVEVLKAGSSDKGDSDDNQDSGDDNNDVPKEGYIYVEADNTYEIYSEIGFKTAISKDKDSSANFSLKKDIDLTDWTNSIGSENTPYSGTINGNGFTITMSDNSSATLVDYLGGNTGIIEKLTLVVESVGSGDYVGGLANVNDGGTIQNCKVIIACDISADKGVGGLVGQNINKGTIKNCIVEVNSPISCDSTSNTDACAGGVVGLNASGTVENCFVSISSTITARYAGGVAGRSGKSVGCGPIQNCLVSGGEINGTVSSDGRAGGVVGVLDTTGQLLACGRIGGTVKARVAGGVVGSVSISSSYGGRMADCFHTGGTVTSSDPSGAFDGAIVGNVTSNSLKITGCYWSDTTPDEPYGVISGTNSTCSAQKVDGSSVTWATVLTTLKLHSNCWIPGDGGLPTLNLQL